MTDNTTIYRQAWGVKLWLDGEAKIVAGFLSHSAALREAANLRKMPGQSAECVRITWAAVPR